MKSTFLTLFFILFASVNSYGAITNFQLTGASNGFDINNPTNTIAWGVFAGPYNSDATGPYDSCRLQPPICTSTGAYAYSGCHKGRVNGDTPITISFTEDSDFEGVKYATALVVVTQTDGTGSEILQSFTHSPTPITKGQPANLTFNWDFVCKGLRNSDGDPNTASVTDVSVTSSCGGTDTVTVQEICAPNDGTGTPVSGNITLDFGLADINGTSLVSKQRVQFKLYTPSFDRGTISITDCDDTSDNGKNGFCDFTMDPGDQGGFLNTSGEGDHPVKLARTSFNYTALDGSSQSLNYTGLKVYFSDGGYQTIHPSNQSVEEFDFLLETPGTLEFINNQISGGLKNGTQYLFKGASIDDSGTVSQIFSDDYFTTPACSTDGGATILGTCPYAIRPSEVAGLFKDSSCFITTASYGSPQEEHVQTFRDFRKNFLWTNWIGVKVITLYNTYGPIGAKWINQNPKSRFYVRSALYPFYLFAKSSLTYGFFITLVFSLFFLATLVMSVKKLFIFYKKAS